MIAGSLSSGSAKNLTKDTSDKKKLLDTIPANTSVSRLANPLTRAIKKTITIEDFARKNIDKILIIINNAINNFATSHNYDLILYENGAFVGPKADISEEIIFLIENN